MVNLVVVVLVLVGIWFLYRCTKRTTLVRYYKSNDPISASTQSIWDSLGSRAVAKKYPFDVVDVNVDETSDKTKTWLAYHKPAKLPEIIKVSKWLGQVEVFNGQHYNSEYEKFGIKDDWFKPKKK